MPGIIVRIGTNYAIIRRPIAAIAAVRAAMLTTERDCLLYV
jgi:hypothetical protein